MMWSPTIKRWVLVISHIVSMWSRSLNVCVGEAEEGGGPTRCSTGEGRQNCDIPYRPSYRLATGPDEGWSSAVSAIYA